MINTEIQKQYHIVGQLLARLTIIRVFVLAATIIFSRPAKLFLVLVIYVIVLGDGIGDIDDLVGYTSTLDCP